MLKRELEQQNEKLEQKNGELKQENEELKKSIQELGQQLADSYNENAKYKPIHEHCVDKRAVFELSKQLNEKDRIIDDLIEEVRKKSRTILGWMFDSSSQNDHIVYEVRDSALFELSVELLALKKRPIDEDYDDDVVSRGYVVNETIDTVIEKIKEMRG